MTLTAAVGTNVGTLIIKALYLLLLGEALFFAHEAVIAARHLRALEALPADEAGILERMTPAAHMMPNG
ncbi:hypothetical protein FACS189475_05840 [Betaproteobacteria bacterium]|nr:hypothetical protein FACS189475_05840 [Betaproteobacteria bacterium]